MKCPNCGNALSQTDLFCGKCGYNLANAPTLLSPQQGFYNATTTTDDETLIAAAKSLNNPYQKLIANLTMPSLILNDDSEHIWRSGNNGEKAYYEKDSFYLERDREWVSGIVKAGYSVKEFTFQALIHFRPFRFNKVRIVKDDKGGTKGVPIPDHPGEFVVRGFNEVHSQFASWEFSNRPLVKQADVFNFKTHEGVNIAHDLFLPIPFLLGIVFKLTGWQTYINQQLIESNTQTTMPNIDRIGIYARNADVVITHTKIWVP